MEPLSLGDLIRALIRRGVEKLRFHSWFTFKADSLLALLHSRPPTRAVRKAILAHSRGSRTQNRILRT